jgi:hypothetical protein
MKLRAGMAALIAAACIVSVFQIGDSDAATKQQRLEAAMNDGVMWSKVRGPGNTLCFADHYHFGSGTVQPTKAKAQADAAAAWAGFVDFEYGAAYADARIAVSKTFKCGKESGGYKCSLEARPCRRY